MQRFLRNRWPLAVIVAALAALTAMNLWHYRGNVTAIFHYDEVRQGISPAPSGFVVLTVPAYDGAQYYRIAREMPRLLSPARWSELRAEPTLSYSYQRFLLPLSAWILSLGQAPLLPYAFLLINLAAIVAAAWITLAHTHKPLYALAVAFCPSAMVALHFTLAEPLVLLLIVLILTRLSRLGRMDALAAVCLCLLMIAREVNVLFAGFLFAFFLWKRRWREAALVLPAFATFFAWHALLYAIFQNVPFFTSTGAKDWPGHAAWEVLIGKRGYDKYRYSAIAVFLGFVAPGALWLGWEHARNRSIQLLATGALCFLGLMLIMPDYIWGSVTSIGRVITPVYPLFLLYCAERDTPLAKLFASSILAIGAVTAIGLALIPHPYFLAP
jgi:hypothetical protein